MVRWKNIERIVVAIRCSFGEFYHYDPAPIIQWIECHFPKVNVTGSNPVGGTCLMQHIQLEQIVMVK